jgi:hypothetical protein
MDTTSGDDCADCQKLQQHITDLRDRIDTLEWEVR